MSRRVARIPARRYRPQSLVAIKRTFWLENFTLSTASTNGFWRYYSFNINALPSFSTELVQVFDRYKINGIGMMFRPRYNVADGSNTTDTTPPGITNQAGNYLHIIKDPYSTITPTGTYTAATLNAFLENGSVKTYHGFKPVRVFWKPTVDEGTANGSGARRRAKWYQTNAASQPTHFGIHVFQQDVNFTGATSQSFDVFVTFYMQFANLR